MSGNTTTDVDLRIISTGVATIRVLLPDDPHQLLQPEVAQPVSAVGTTASRLESEPSGSTSRADRNRKRVSSASPKRRRRFQTDERRQASAKSGNRETVEWRLTHRENVTQTYIQTDRQITVRVTSLTLRNATFALFIIVRAGVLVVIIYTQTTKLGL